MDHADGADWCIFHFRMVDKCPSVELSLLPRFPQSCGKGPNIRLSPILKFPQPRSLSGIVALTDELIRRRDRKRLLPLYQLVDS